MPEARAPYSAGIRQALPFWTRPCADCGEPLGRRRYSSRLCFPCAAAGAPSGHLETEIQRSLDSAERELQDIKTMLLAYRSTALICTACDTVATVEKLPYWRVSADGAWTHNCAREVLGRTEYDLR